MRKVDVTKEGIFAMMYPGLVVLVTSIDEKGKPNVLTMAWTTPTSYDPPMVAISIRPERFSYGLMKKTGEFVVNVPTKNLLREMMVCGTTSGRTVNKFKKANLTPLPSKKVQPPIIKECIAHLECKITNEVQTGDHMLLIGRVVVAYADKEAFPEKGYDLKVVQPLLHLQDSPHTFTFPSETVHPLRI